MPELQVHIVAGRTLEQKRAGAKALTEAMVSAFGVPPEAVVVEFIESPATNKAKGGFLFSDRSPGQPAVKAAQ